MVRARVRGSGRIQGVRPRVRARVGGKLEIKAKEQIWSLKQGTRAGIVVARGRYYHQVAQTAFWNSLHA